MQTPPTPEQVENRTPRKPSNRYQTFETKVREAGLNERQTQTVIAKLRDPTISDKEACRRGGYSGQRHIPATRIWNVISSKLGPIMQILGVSERDIGQAVKEALIATTKTVIYKKFYENGHLSKIVPQVLEVPDHAIRLKAVELALRSDRFHVKHDHEGEVKHRHVVNDKDRDAVTMLERREEAVNTNYEILNEPN